jgi:hypothetical protein
MRRWFLFALIALLPLRGWVGEAMAGQMLAQQLVAIKSVAASPVSMGAAEHKDCMGHGMAAAGDSAAAQPQPADCPTCAHCQVCSSVALALPAPVALPPLAVSAPPGSAPMRFASADVARGFKPPIS